MIKKEYKMNTSKIVKLVCAALLVNNADATQTTSELISEAMTQTTAGTESYMHLSSALEALKSDAETMASHSQRVTVPIDETRALTVNVQPTFVLDEIQSVTLKSFRKIVGYDTFESIRRKNRNEAKDTSDYYNVTVSMIVRRRPAEASAAPSRDPYAPDGAPALAATLDKGFPYDD